MIIGISQNSFLKLLALIIGVSYYIFVQKDLISVTQALAAECLENAGSQHSLCITCVKRSKFNIAKGSSIYINDNVNMFKTMVIEQNYGLECQDLIQFISYESPLKTAEEIKIDTSSSLKELLQVSHIQISPVVNKFEAQLKMETIAILQVLEKQQKQSILVTYSPSDSEEALKLYAQILSATSLTFQLVILVIFLCKKQFLTSVLIMIISNSMIFGSAYFNDLESLVRYSAILAVCLYFVFGTMGKVLTITAVAFLLLIVSVFGGFYAEGLVVVLLAYIVGGNGQQYNKTENISGICMFLLIICAMFEQHHHWLSYSLRKIIEYTILCFSPIFIAIVSSYGIGRGYNEVQNEPESSGISLPGFEDAEEVGERN